MQEIRESLNPDRLAEREAQDRRMRISEGHRTQSKERETEPNLAGNRKERRAAKALSRVRA